jgi:hypothetical protein
MVVDDSTDRAPESEDEEVKSQSLLLPFLVVALGLSVRWFGEGVGFPSEGWDYGSHLVLLNELMRGHLFPEWGGGTGSVHVLATWLPLYHGILGAHFFSACLVWLFGITAPKAMLIVGDLSLALYLGVIASFLYQSKSRFTVFVGAMLVMLFAVPAFTSAVEFGFFSQISSFGFYALSLWFLERRQFKTSAFVLAWAGFTYPDGLMWFMPVMTMAFTGGASFRELAKRPFAAFFGLIIPTTLFFIQLVRQVLPGAVAPVYSAALLFLPVFIIGVRAQDLSSERKLLARLTFLVMVLTALVSLLVDASDLSYYAAKNFYWAALLLPLLIGDRGLGIRQKGLIVIASVTLAALPGLNEWRNWSSVERYVFARSLFTDHDAKEISRIGQSRSCSRVLVLPPCSIEDKSPFVLAANSIFPVIVPHSLQFQKNYERLVSGPTELHAKLKDNCEAETAKLTELNRQAGGVVDCLISPASNDQSDGLRHWQSL